MEVGLKIKGYLRERGITQSFLSEKTGISRPKLNLTLSGKRRMTFEEYELICGALKVEVGFFLKAREQQQDNTDKDAS